MKTKSLYLLLLFIFLIHCTHSKAQYQFITNAPAANRLPRLWQYCSDNLISDKDSAATCRFLQGVESLADSLHDEQLKKYATYFRLCFRVLFSDNYERYFAKGDYESVANVYRRAQQWARQNGHRDIDAVCEHYIGEVYYYAAQYGPAFEHLLRADDLFLEIGYEKIPAISTYLYDLALNYYKFKERDKALHYFKEATRFPFYANWVELSTLNSIGLIYFNNREWNQAITYYRQTITKAHQYHDNAWLGIASGNLGNVFAQQGQYDSALVYHTRNFRINQLERAPEDAAWSALAIAEVLVKQGLPDSAFVYINQGQALAEGNIIDTASRLTYQRELLAVVVALYKRRNDYEKALFYTDSLNGVKSRLQLLLDDKVLKREEAKRYVAEINLLQTEKRLSHFRLYVLVVSILLTAIIVAFLFNRYRLRKRRQIENAAREKAQLALAKKRVEEQLQQAEQSLMAYLDTIKEKTNLIENLGVEIQRLKETTTPTTDLQGLASNMEKLVSTTILTEEGWQYFRGLFEQVYPGFVHRLREKYTDLSPAETRVLILTKLNLLPREMANMLGISLDSLRKARYRLRKKLNLDEKNSLEMFIQEV